MRERLQGLMLFRVVLITIFLSSALMLDSDALSNLSSTRNLVLLSLIVGTYALTILYANALRRALSSIRSLARTQVSMDLLTSATLIVATGGLRSSVFIPVFFFPIIASALVLGRRHALYASTCVATLIVSFTLFDLGLFDGVDSRIALALDNPNIILLESSMLISFSYLLAFFSGRLSEQLGDAELELRRQRLDLERLRSLNANILESMDSGLLTIDDAGTVIFANRAALSITGIDSEDILGSPIESTMPGVASLLSDSTDRHDASHTRPDGTDLHLGFSTSRLRDAESDASGHIVIFQDLTRVRALEEQAKRSERLASIGQLAASIAHEIRNPLGAISGSVELLPIMKDSPEDQRALMDVVLSEVSRLNTLITQFLEYSRPRPLTPSPIDPQECIDEIVALFVSGHPDHDIDLTHTSTGERGEQNLDAEILKQIIWNLLNNAFEAQTQEDDDAHVSIYIDSHQEDDHIRFVVEDDGPGIPEGVVDRIFEPFFTTKQTGTGLGLATIYRLADEHGGTIEYERARTLDGARFSVTLRTLPEETP